MLKLITLNEIKVQCKVDIDDESQDQELNDFGMAACGMLEAELHRAVYATVDEVIELDDDALILSTLRHQGENIKLALKLMVGHFYRNREATTDLTLKELPQGVASLIGVYRLVPYGGLL